MNYETVILEMLKEIKNEQIKTNDKLSNLEIAIASIKDEFMEFQGRNERSHDKIINKINELEI